MSSLLDISNAKVALKLSDPTPEETDILSGLVESIWSGMESYCGRRFDGTTALTEYYDGSGHKILPLNEYPIISITSIVRTKEDADDTQVTIASSEYNVLANRGQLVMHPVNFSDSSIWIKGDNNYKIIYTAGYTTSTLPKEIKLAWEIWLSIVFKTFQDNLHHVAAVSYNDENITFEQDSIPKKVAQLLRQYRRLY